MNLKGGLLIMARGHRKLGRPTDQRLALLRNQVTNLLYHGSIVTTDTRAKEVRKLAEKLITVAIKEHSNFTEVEVEAKVARKDESGARVKQVVNGKKVTVYDKVRKTIKKDNDSRVAARRRILASLYKVTEKPDLKKKRKTVSVDMAEKMFGEIAPKYKDRNGGYTRMTKMGPRKGDGAEMVILELV